MALERKTVTDPETGVETEVVDYGNEVDVKDVAKFSLELHETVQAMKGRSESEQKEMEDKIVKRVEGELERQQGLAAQRRLSGLAGDYAMEGADLFSRSLDDGGPFARQLKGEALSPADSAVCRFQDACDKVLMGAMAMGMDRHDYNERNVEESMTKGPKATRRSRSLWNQFKTMRDEFIRATTGWDTTQLTNWMPDDFTPQVQDRYTLALRVAAWFPTAVMTRSPQVLPAMWARRSLAKSMHQETTDFSTLTAPTPGEDVTPGVVTLTAKTSFAYDPLSWETDWDSVIAMVPLMIGEHADFHRWCHEQALINGDTTSTHQDSDVTGGSSSTDFRAAYKGLRKLALAGSCSTDINATYSTEYSVAMLRGIRENQGKYGVLPDETALFVGPKGYIKTLSISEVKTVDVLGPMATVPRGTLAVIDGHPIIVSEAMRENLNASGVYDGSVTTKHSIMLANKKGFMIGNRMPIQTTFSETALQLYGGKMVMSVARNAFAPIWTPSTTYPTVWLGYNCTN
jgi:hypothetical protein